MFTKSQRSTFPYWFAHWCAFNMTALNLGVWKWHYLFHDIEKPWLKLFWSYDKVQNYHRSHSKHHLKWLKDRCLFDIASPKNTQCHCYKMVNLKHLQEFDWEAMVIDWECSRFTKQACPFDASDELWRVVQREPHALAEVVVKHVKPILQRWGIYH